jgi:prolyl-tRNA editing enzyme YbaK/EbsC (Cys-tRNA(Pro) deacylase)
MIGRLLSVPALERPDLLAPPVALALKAWRGQASVESVQVAEIDPDLAHTVQFCAAYDVRLEESANCVVVATRRGQERRLVACVVLATTRADVNGLVRRHVDARKATFAPMEVAVAQSGMEYGGITPIGLPADWPLLVDAAVAAVPHVVVGSGLRRSKLILSGQALLTLPDAQLIIGLGVPVGQEHVRGGYC